LIFDGINKRIILTTTTTSASEIWSKWVEWLQGGSSNGGLSDKDREHLLKTATNVINASII